MTKPKTDPKREALARDGVLNPHPEAVRDPLFAANPFFDPDDLLQVRYEMVRRHRWWRRLGSSSLSTIPRPARYLSVRIALRGSAL